VAGYTIPAAPPPSSLQLRYDAEARQFVLTSDRALGWATIRALDHHHVAVETVRAIVKKGEMHWGQVPVSANRGLRFRETGFYGQR
jgi:hypothetical protein